MVRSSPSGEMAERKRKDAAAWAGLIKVSGIALE